MIEDFDIDEGDEAEDVDNDVVEVISPAVKAKLRRLVEAREARDLAKTEWERLKKDCAAVEIDVFDMFEATDENGEPRIKGTLKVPLGEPYGTVAFRTRETHFAKIVDDEEAQEWYEERAMMEEVSAPKFVMKRLSEDVRGALEQGITPGEAGWPKGLTYTTSRGMTVTSEK